MKRKKVLKWTKITYNKYMKENHTGVYNILSILLLISVLLWMGLRLTIRVDMNTRKMNTAFNAVSSTILEDIFLNKQPTSRTSNFVKLSNLALSSPSLKSLLITDNNGKPVYIFARNAGAVKRQEGVPPVQIIDTIKDREISTFESFNGSIYHIQSVFTVLKNSLLAQTIKIGLVVLLALCLLSIFIMVSLYRKSGKKSSQHPSTIHEKTTEYTNKESFPLLKLTNELKRAASFDQDLTLVLIKTEQDFIKTNNSSFLEFLHEIFSYSDLIFKYSETEFALILPNEDIDSGIARIRDFDQNASNKFNILSLYPFHYGLSSRNGRLIDGQILYSEASAALRKSLQDNDAHIIGFRPDPAKYREFLSKGKY